VSGKPAMRDHDPVARYLLLAAAAFLVVGGLIMIFSASSVADVHNYGDSWYHLKRQALWLVPGLLAMAVLAKLDYRRIKQLIWPALIGADILLAYVLFAGHEQFGAQRWIEIGGGMRLQPSEFAKLAVVAALALVLAATPPHKRTLTGLAKPLALIVLPAAGLIMFQPDMGTTMSLIVAVMFLLWLGDFDARSFFVATAAVASVIPIAIMVAPYRMQRYQAFLDPWKDPQHSGYQIIQALYAFGSGGIKGVGLGLSRQKFFYLPAAHTDFIFAIIGEELGLIGALTVVFAFVLLTYAGLRIASRTQDRFGRLLAGGVVVVIAAQAAMNMAAVTGMMPITGIPLPFVSYGGTALMLNLACLGIVLSVYRYGNAGVRRAAQPRSVRREENVIEGPAQWRRHGGSHLSSIDGGRRAAR
jgi:cell division protein FtsW